MNRKTEYGLVGSFIIAATAALAPAADAEPMSFDAGGVPLLADVIVDGLEHPWGLDFLPDGAMIVTERPGRMRIVENGTLSAPIAGVPEIATGGEGGLLDVAVSPDFAENGLIFFAYSEPRRGGAGTSIARARLVRDAAGARLEDVTVIFSVEPATRSMRHFGSRILVSPKDGTLFVTIGDQGQANRSQDWMDSAGAVLHINPDGTPVATSPAERNRLPEIWSKGHRNPQGLVWDNVSGGLLTVEHGARGGDEVNAPEAGKNYGWPVISYGVNYNGSKIGKGTAAPGYEQPLFYWDPSIAPSGLVAYDGDMFPEWRGDLLVGSLKFQLLSRLDRDDKGKILGEERMLEGEFGRIRDVEQAPDGSILLLTDEDDGALIRLSRAK